MRIPHTDSRGLNVSLGAWPAVGQARVLLVLERPVLVELITLTLDHGVCTTRAVTTAAEVDTLLAKWQPHLVILNTDLHATQIRRDPPMARPPARDLTERELEVMHVFWKHPDATAAGLVALRDIA